MDVGRQGDLSALGFSVWGLGSRLWGLGLRV